MEQYINNELLDRMGLKVNMMHGYITRYNLINRY